MKGYLTEFDQRRLDIYLGDIKSGRKVDDDTVLDGLNVLTCGACEPRASLLSKTAHRFDDADFDDRFDIYIGDSQAFVSGRAPFKKIRVRLEDNRVHFDRPTIVKSRLISDRASQGVILPLEFERHWGPLGKLARADKPFAEKDDKLVWRGATTGDVVETEQEIVYPPRYHLFFCDPFADGMDIKFNSICQPDLWPGSIPENRVEAMLGDELTLAEQLNSKHILVLEGNDVATSLKWAVASNSTVVMPPPTCETWFCEGELVAWEHYVPLAHDLSDMGEKYEWCLANPARCEDIAKAGQAYISQFLDPKREARIVRAVVKGYASVVGARFALSPKDVFAYLNTLRLLSIRRTRFQRRVRNFAKGSGLVAS